VNGPCAVEALSSSTSSMSLTSLPVELIHQIATYEYEDESEEEEFEGQGRSVEHYRTETCGCGGYVCPRFGG
jgi:hypothetical protein